MGSKYLDIFNKVHLLPGDADGDGGRQKSS